MTVGGTFFLLFAGSIICAMCVGLAIGYFIGQSEMEELTREEAALLDRYRARQELPLPIDLPIAPMSKDAGQAEEQG